MTFTILHYKTSLTMTFCFNLRTRNCLLKWPKIISQKINYLFFWVLGDLAPKKYYFSQENAKMGGPKNPLFGQKLSQKKLFNYLFFSPFAFLRSLTLLWDCCPFFSCFVPFSSYSLSSSYSISLYFCLSLSLLFFSLSLSLLFFLAPSIPLFLSIPSIPPCVSHTPDVSQVFRMPGQWDCPKFPCNFNMCPKFFLQL